jgi:hypothetical protein
MQNHNFRIGQNTTTRTPIVLDLEVLQSGGYNAAPTNVCNRCPIYLAECTGSRINDIN